MLHTGRDRALAVSARRDVEIRQISRLFLELRFAIISTLEGIRYMLVVERNKSSRPVYTICATEIRGVKLSLDRQKDV